MPSTVCTRFSFRLNVVPVVTVVLISVDLFFTLLPLGQNSQRSRTLFNTSTRPVKLSSRYSRYQQLNHWTFIARCKVLWPLFRCLLQHPFSHINYHYSNLVYFICCILIHTGPRSRHEYIYIYGASLESHFEVKDGFTLVGSVILHND